MSGALTPNPTDSREYCSSMSTPQPGATADRKPNLLAGESSPYLLQHRFNPVDWRPWSPEAFEEARRRDIPIFLSVGYSTCYWCHVMERESFESEAIAAQMNRSFVCIKVDREERPDVDDVYMAAVQAFTQRGGWPMSVFLEPHTLKPFWAGTYFPAEARFQGVPTFPHVLESISKAWRENRAEVLQQAENLADAVRERVGNAQPTAVHIGEPQVAAAVTQLLQLHDPTHGGFGPAPKFPQPSFLDLLLAVRAAAGDDQTRSSIDAALHSTLSHMARGGIFDQIGGGFHRYSVDAKWQVPHFEKMLYDNGALAETYARAITLPGFAGKVMPATLYARTARRICDYVLREMLAPDGAFFAAQDAEVDHREGLNYVWTRPQLVDALGQPDATWIARIYGLDEGPNFRDPHHPNDPPANVLFVNDRSDAEINLSAAHGPALARLDALNAKLYAARSLRPQPGTDAKILVGWNGLMIAGLAVTGRVLNEPRFVEAARRAADFILRSMRRPDGSLFRSFAGEGGGRAAIPAFLEDYALLTHGLIELHRALGPPSSPYLESAVQLTARAESLFADMNGGYFDSPPDHHDLFVRTHSAADGAMVSGASAMIHNLIDLAALTGDSKHSARAAAALAAISADIAAHPLGAANSTRALLRLLAADRRSLESALAGAPSPESQSEASDENAHVEILSAVDRVEVAQDQPVGILLKVRISPGFHLAAANPGDGVVGLTPFRVQLVGGQGAAIYADYPAGEPLGDHGEIRAYKGEFDLPVVLERSGDWKGNPIIAVTFQPCTDRACLAARTVELDVSIERA